MTQAGSGDAIPTTRDQAILLLEEVDWDPDRLTNEQREAIRLLYDLAEYSAIAEVLEPGTSCRCKTDGTVCGRYGTEECTCEHHGHEEASG